MSYAKPVPTIQAQLDFIAECEEERKEQGLSQRALSRKIYVSHNTYSCHIRNNRGNMSFRTANAIAEGLGKRLVVYLGDPLEELPVERRCHNCGVNEGLGCHFCIRNDSPDDGEILKDYWVSKEKIDG